MSHLRVIACLQARMGSTRLPGKGVVDIAGKTPIAWIVHRLKAAKEIDETVLVTSVDASNDPLVAEAERLGLRVWREKDEADLVSRYWHALETFQADAFVRVTGDCPLVDPALVDEMVRRYRSEPDAWDAMTNASPPSWPDGLDLDLFPRKTIERLRSEIPEGDLHREWMTPYVYKHPDQFRILNFPAPRDLTSYRVTLDYPEDLELFRRFFTHFGERTAGWKEVIAYLDAHPDVKALVATHVDTVIVQDANMRSGAYKKLTDNP